MTEQPTLFATRPAREPGGKDWQQAHDRILDAIRDGQATPEKMAVDLNNLHQTTRYARNTVSKRMAELAAWGQLEVCGKQGQAFVYRRAS